MRTIVFVIATALASAAGCAGPSSVGATFSTDGYYADGYYGDPYLSYVRPGVYAVANWHYPVFYSNNAYWRYHDGHWLRSRYYTGGSWYRARPPVSVLRVDRPSRYRYYRPSTGRTHVDIREERVFRDRSRFDHRFHNNRPYVVPRDGRTYDRRSIRPSRDRSFDRRNRSRVRVIDRS